MQSKQKNEPSESLTTSENKWAFVLFDSPQWRAWKRLETPGGKRWAFRYRDPEGRGVGCAVPTEWPPGYLPTEADLQWHPPRDHVRADTGQLSEYLTSGGPLPSPTRGHIGRFEDKDPGPEGRRVMPRSTMPDPVRKSLDWWVMHTHTCWAGKIPCTPRMRAYLDEMARENRTYVKDEDAA